MLTIRKESSLAYCTRLVFSKIRGGYLLVVAPITIDNRVKMKPRFVFTLGLPLSEDFIVPLGVA